MITWSDSLFDAKDYSKGPFTIDFTCPNGDSYGTVSKVAQNTTIYAKRSRGRKSVDQTRSLNHTKILKKINRTGSINLPIKIEKYP